MVLRDALEIAQKRAAQTLDLNSKVRQLSVRFFARPWPTNPRLNLLGRLEEAEMEELQARLDDMQQRMAAQEATLAEEQRNAAAAREQLADRERLIQQLRNGSQPRDGSPIAGAHNHDPSTSSSDGARSGSTENGRAHPATGSSTPNASGGRIDNLGDLMNAFRSEMNAAVGAMKKDILTEVRAQGGAGRPDGAHFEDRLREAERGKPPLAWPSMWT